MTPEELQADAARRHLELQRKHAPQVTGSPVTDITAAWIEERNNGLKLPRDAEGRKVIPTSVRCTCVDNPGNCPHHDETRDFMPDEQPATNLKVRIGVLLGAAAEALAEASTLMIAEGQEELKG